MLKLFLVLLLMLVACTLVRQTSVPLLKYVVVLMAIVVTLYGWRCWLPL